MLRQSRSTLARSLFLMLAPSLLFSLSFLSISTCDRSTTEGRGRGLYGEGGATNQRPGTPVCSFSEAVDGAARDAPRSNSPLSLPRRAYLLAVFIFRFISLPPFVPPDALSWPFPSFGCCETYAFLIRDTFSGG